MAALLELLAVLAAAALSLRWPILALVALLVAGSIARWSRGRTWVEPGEPAPMLALYGAIAGAVALALAVLVATPLLERISTRSIEWTQITPIRGNPGLVATAALLATAEAVAAELVFRRWILDRALELGVARPLAVLIAGLCEGLAVGGPADVRLGAALTGVGLGLVYLGAGRRLAPAIAARVAFEVGALTLVGMRLL